MRLKAQYAGEKKTEGCQGKGNIINEDVGKMKILEFLALYI